MEPCSFKMPCQWRLLSLLLLMLMPALSTAATGDPVINRIWPQNRGVAGASALTIVGQNLKKDFSIGSRPEDGYKCYFVSDDEMESYEVNILNGYIASDGSSLVATTTPMPTGWYNLELLVDGKSAIKTRSLQTRALTSHTPTIESIVISKTLTGFTPKAGQEFVTVCGMILTSYLNGTEFGERNSTNGITARLIAVYAGKELCDKYDATGDPLPIFLNGASGESKYGCFTALCNALDVGMHNLTYIVGEEFGRSVTDTSLTCSDISGTIGNYEKYPVVESMDNHEGTPGGGTYVTLVGDFGSKVSDIDVLFAGEKGTIKERKYDTATKKTTLTMVTPAKPTPICSNCLGGRGVRVDVYEQNATVANDTAAQDVVATATPTTTEHPDTSRFTYTSSASDVVGHMRFYYVPGATGLHEFYIKTCNDASASPAVSTSVANFSLSQTDMDSTQKQAVTQKTFVKSALNTNTMVNLTADERYFVEAIFYGTKGACVNISVFTCSTPYNEGQLCGAYNQREDITVTSTDVNAIQKFDLSGWGSNPTVSHVFTISISTPGSNFRICIAKSCTVPIRTEDGATIEKHLKELPTLGSTESVDSVTPATAASSFTVTIQSENAPTMEVVAEDMTATSAVSVTGPSPAAVASGKELVFNLDSHRSPPIGMTAGVADPVQMQSAIHTMCSVRCPNTIPPTYRNPLGVRSTPFYSNDFEGSSGSYEEEPFCGSKSFCTLRSYIDFYHSRNLIEAHINTHVGFAYILKGCDLLSKWHYYVTVITDSHKFTWWREVAYNFTSDGEWHYTVLDLKAQILLDHAKWIAPGTENNVKAYVKIIRVHRIKHCTDPRARICIDEVFVGLPDTSITISDLAALRSVPPVRSKSVAVTMSGNNYTVEIERCDCNVANDMTIEGAPVSWAARTTIQTSNVAVAGNFDLTRNGETFTIDVTTSEVDFKKELESKFTDMGSVDVEKMSDRYSCTNFKWRITYNTKGGCQPPMTITAKSLTGNNPDVATSLVQLGGDHKDPPSGSHTRVPQDKTQAQVFVDKLPARCENDTQGSCTFEYNAALQVVVSSVTATSGTDGDTLTITGQAFDTTNVANNVVKIGTAYCEVTVVTSATSLQCKLGPGKAGDHPVELFVKGNGKAVHSPATSFEYELTLSSVSPTSGSAAGCTRLTIDGDGFDSTAKVTVGGTDCPIANTATDIKQNEIICQVPARTGSATSVDIVVTVGTSPNTKIETLTNAYTYDPSATYTPVITSVEDSSGTAKTTAVAWGGETLTIKGTGFTTGGTVVPTVTVGSKQVTVNSYTDTEIALILPAVPRGDNSVKVYVPNKGCAAQSNILPKLAVTFAVTKVCPSVCSGAGGCTFTITGTANSFPTVSPETKLKVNVGPTPCTIVSSTSSTLTCKMGRVLKYHDITYNSKSHQWEPKHLTLKVGECARWMWTVSPFANHKVRVQQIDSPTSTTLATNGFESNPAASGSYTWCAGQTATKIYYWSTYIDIFQSISFHGTLTVVAKSAWTATMAISAESDEDVKPDATGITNCGSNPTPCPTVVTPSAGTGLDIMLDNAYSPVVTNMAVSQTNVPFNMDFTGTNLGTNCVTGVSVGSHAATVNSANPTAVQATLPATAEPESYQTHDVTLTSTNGYAIVAGSLPGALQVNVTAVVTSVTPTEGSTAGCTELTINGKGFKDGKTKVSIDNVPCAIVAGSVTYSELKCRTGAHLASSALDVKVEVDDEDVPCVPTTVCMFEYTAANTPEVTSISPSPAVASGSTVTILGSDLAASSEVTIGTSSCTPVVAVTGGISCTAPSLSAVDQPVKVRRDWGCAVFAVGVTPQLKGTATLTTVNPTSGSIHGGNVITLSGSGFDDAGTTVLVGTNPCTDVNVLSTSQLTCTAPYNGASGSVLVTVTAPSDFASVAGVAYSFDTSRTPVVNTINAGPTLAGVAGASITLAGANFGASVAENAVKLGAVSCGNLALPSANTLTCDVGRDSPGAKPVIVTVTGSGSSDPSTSVKFEHTLTLTSISPTSGSTAGGQKVTFLGNGIFASGTATMALCGQACTDCEDVTGGVRCTSPSGAAGTVCPASVTYSGATPVTLSSVYTYSSSKTPDISGISQRRGGTAGGVSLTISGTNFGTNCAALTVTIEKIECSITDCNDTAVVCITGPVPKNVSHTTRCTTNIAAVQNIQLHVQGCGLATESMSLADGNPDFQYIDEWSSPYTWGGKQPPVGGDFVFIPSEQTILLDVSTPVLKLVLIHGCLIFDDSPLTVNGTPGRVRLESEFVFINDGGFLQAKPKCGYYNEIILHGSPRSMELPFYGAKVLAVRNGTLDIEGCHTPVTWTELKDTVGPGDTVIKLKTPVKNWMVGFWIIITTTKDRHSQHQTEKRQIAAITADGLTITLATALSYKHYAMTHTLANGVKVKCLQAYVGLLSHNARIEGSDDSQFHTTVSACSSLTNPGVFAKQSCFQGRAGAEVGSDQFGATIMLHSARPDTDEAVARLVSVEIFNCGQAFRLGRYPLHFHNLGGCGTFSGTCQCKDNGTISYLRDSSIHKSFNRAVNIHGTCDILITNNVVYDIMGGALFFEDSVEQGNTLSYNLAVFVKPSSSLQVDDQTPAAFWLTNAVNCIIHNVAIGNYGFGFWYRIEDAQGSNQNAPIKPKNQLVCKFFNNTANFNVRYGLWVFEFYFPKGSVAVFENFHACCNLRGAESGDSSLIRFSNFVLANNEAANLEMLLNHVPTSVRYDKDASFAVRDTTIVGKLEHGPAASKCGLVLPFDSGLAIDNVNFHNFTVNSGVKSSAICLVRITCTCSDLCGGYEYRTSNISWYDVTLKSSIGWEHQWALVDLDGTLTEASPLTPGVTVVPDSDLLPSTCTKGVTEWSLGGGYNGAICPAGIYFVKFNFNKVMPESLIYKNVIIQDENGKTTKIVWRFLSRDYAKGYFALLPVYKTSDSRSCATYQMWFENAEQISNISYSAQWTGLQDTCAIMCHNVTQDVYDRVKILLTNNPGESPVPLGPSSTHGQYTFNNNTLCYIMKDGPTHRNVAINVKAEKCFYTNCTPPVDPATQAPEDVRPATYCVWSDPSAWSTCGNSWTVGSAGRRKRAAGVGVPTAGAKITIGNYTILDLNGTLPCFESIVVEKGGTLEVEPTNDVNICATYIVIEGGGRLIVGREGAPATGNIEIRLEGDHSTPYFPTTNGPDVGSKVLAVYGGADIHGSAQDPQWTSLSVTANVGDNVISISANVSGSWQVGDDIVLAPTSYSPWQTETFTITAIDATGTKLTLNSTLQHKHLAYSDEACKGTAAGGCVFAAEVGHLSRNVKIVGVDGGKMISQSFGCRVLVASKSGAIGYGRFSNVQFDHCGQDLFTAIFDPHCAVAFLNTGEVTDIKPSYILSNTFPNLLGQGICVYGAKNFSISNNVLHHAIGQGIKTDAVNVTVKANLVVLVLWPGSYLGRKESTNKNLGAGIETNKAQNVNLEDNAVAGSERAGYRIDGISCSLDVGFWSNNTVHTTVMGIAIIPGTTPGDDQDGVAGEKCSMVTGFRVFRAWGFGLYVQVPVQNIIVAASVFCENGVGIFIMIKGPGVKGHGFIAHSIRVHNSSIVGTAPGFDCTNDKPDTGSGGADAVNFGLASVYLTRCKSVGKVGICHLFSSGGNLFPFMPVILAKVQPAMYGISYVEDTCFAHFNLACPSRGRDTMISYNKLSKDMDYSFKLRGITLVNVDRSSIAWVPYPDPSTAKASQCGTTACDGPRKFIVSDLDGSTLGCNGSLLPDMDYQWDGDTRFGIGDYRIPKVALVDVYNRRRNISEVYQRRGIIGAEEHGSWDAESHTYLVCGQEYEWFSTESLDSDFKTRIYSPTLVRAKNVTTNMTTAYLTIQPSDAGVCGGYPCMERPGYQQKPISPGHSYEVIFTGTTPQNLRIHFPYTSSSQSFKVCIFYSSAQKLDVYVLYDPANNKKRYILPVNGYYSGTEIKYHSTNYHQFALSITGNTTGANLFDYDTKMLCMIVRGPQPLIIQTKTTILFKGGLEMTADEFFGKNIVQNLAYFLGIPANKVRVVNIVAANSGATGRKKRALDVIEVIIQIADSAPEAGGTQDLDYAALSNVYNILIEGFQTGTLHAALGNVTFTYFQVSPPVPSHDTQLYADLVAYADKNGEALGGESTITVPDVMHLYGQPVGGYEGGPFTKYAALRILDDQRNVVPVLVANNAPWTVTAKLENNNGQATITGSTTIPFTRGWAIFNAISVSDIGNYTLAFELTNPTSFNKIARIVSPTPVVITKRPLTLHASVAHSATINTNFQIDLTVKDPSGSVVTDLGWKGHTWTYTMLLHPAFVANLGGSLFGSLNNTGLTSSESITLDKTGYFPVDVSVASQPAGYGLQAQAIVHVVPASYVPPTKETSATLSITLNADSTVLLQPEAFRAHFANQLQSQLGPDSVISHITISGTGPYTIGFVVSGTEVGVSTALNNLGSYVIQSCPALSWHNVVLSCSSTLMVNGTSFYPLLTTPTPKALPADITLALVLGICIPVGVILVVVIIVICAIKRGKLTSKSSGGVVAASPEPARKEGSLMFTSQSGLLPSRAASMVSHNPAGRAQQDTSFSSTEDSASSSPNLNSSTTGLLSNRTSTPNVTPPSSAAAQRAKTPASSESAKSWKSRLSLSRGGKKDSKPLQVTPRGTPSPAQYDDPPPPPYHSEDSAVSQTSKQGVNVAYSPREIRFNMSDVS